MLAARDPRQRDTDFLAYVAGCPCVACMVHGKVRWGVHVAHLRSGSLEHGKRPTGTAEKPSDRWSLPLCPPHHVGDTRKTRTTQHAMSETAFWAEFGINPFDLCVALYAAYAAGQPGYPIIARFAAQGRRTIEETPTRLETIHA